MTFPEPAARGENAKLQVVTWRSFRTPRHTRVSAPPVAGFGHASSSSRSSLARVPSVATPILAHLDLDAFFAAVEELEDPSLREQPLVVGGDPHGRGVVSTSNYVARRFGIHSAMSSAEARRRCPHAVFLRPRHALYRQ